MNREMDEVLKKRGKLTKVLKKLFQDIFFFWEAVFFLFQSGADF